MLIVIQNTRFFYKEMFDRINRFTLYVLSVVLILVGLRKYKESKWGKCKNKVKLDGKVVLVTGANSGIGFEVAKELASRNGQIILACRSVHKANLAINRIKQCLVNNPILIPMAIDLGSLKSVRDFAELVKKRFKKIDILINNAGLAYHKSERLRTEDGFEIHFGVNHLGHFYLTCLLEDLLVEAQGRIVVISSSLHEKGKIDLKAIRNFDFPDDENLYANSKLANIYFAQELAKRIKEKGVNVYALCPGWAYTGLFRYTFKWYLCFFAPIAFLFMRSSKQGSQTVIYCATEQSLSSETGLLYRDCKSYNSRMIFFDKVARDLWCESEEMIASIVKAK